MDARFQPVQVFLRKTHLLPLVMEGRYAVEVALNYPSNRRFDRENPDFPTPPARLAFDAYANVNHEYYRRTGQERATEIARYVRKYVDTPTPSFLEWGCGCARVLRHLVDELPGSTLTGTDYNAVSIGWCRQNIPGIRFELNDLAPPLPFGDAEFDFVFALSVFTHLSEAMHHAWFEELRRVTKPGGVIALSAHGQNFYPLLVTEEHARWERGELIVRNEESEEGKRMYLAFHPERFMREELLVGNEVLEHVTDRGTRKQDFWIVRRS